MLKFAGTFCEISICNTGFFGPNCDMECIATDNCGGHFACAPVTGQKVCNPGWTGLESDCVIRDWRGVGPDPQCPTDRVCANGGTCFRGSCCCAPNWYGPGCTTFCAQRDDCGAHYSCNPQGQRVCNPGWTGTNCDIRTWTGVGRDPQCPDNYDCLNGGKDT